MVGVSYGSVEDDDNGGESVTVYKWTIRDSVVCRFLGPLQSDLNHLI